MVALMAQSIATSKTSKTSYKKDKLDPADATGEVDATISQCLWCFVDLTKTGRKPVNATGVV